MLAPLGVSSAGVTFPWSDRPSAVAAQVAADARVAAGGGFVLLNPGAAWENKRWPVEHFGDLARALGERHGLVSVVTWGPGEQDRADAVAARAVRAIVSPATALHDVLALRARRASASPATPGRCIWPRRSARRSSALGPTRRTQRAVAAADLAVSRAGECVCFHKRQCLRGQAYSIASASAGARRLHAASGRREDRVSVVRVRAYASRSAA
jgi:hypothetical protein